LPLEDFLRIEEMFSSDDFLHRNMMPYKEYWLDFLYHMSANTTKGVTKTATLLPVHMGILLRLKLPLYHVSFFEYDLNCGPVIGESLAYSLNLKGLRSLHIHTETDCWFLRNILDQCSHTLTCIDLYVHSWVIGALIVKKLIELDCKTLLCFKMEYANAENEMMRDCTITALFVQLISKNIHLETFSVNWLASSKEIFQQLSLTNPNLKNIDIVVNCWCTMTNMNSMLESCQKCDRFSIEFFRDMVSMTPHNRVIYDTKNIVCDNNLVKQSTLTIWQGERVEYEGFNPYDFDHLLTSSCMNDLTCLIFEHIPKLNNRYIHRLTSYNACNSIVELVLRAAAVTPSAGEDEEIKYSDEHAVSITGNGLKTILRSCSRLRKFILGRCDAVRACDFRDCFVDNIQYDQNILTDMYFQNCNELWHSMAVCILRANRSFPREYDQFCGCSHVMHAHVFLDADRGTISRKERERGQRG